MFFRAKGDESYESPLDNLVIPDQSTIAIWKSTLLGLASKESTLLLRPGNDDELVRMRQVWRPSTHPAPASVTKAASFVTWLALHLILWSGVEHSVQYGGSPSTAPPILHGTTVLYCTKLLYTDRYRLIWYVRLQVHTFSRRQRQHFLSSFPPPRQDHQFENAYRS